MTYVNKDEKVQEMLKEIARELRELLSGISVEEVVRLIREDRDSR